MIEGVGAQKAARLEPKKKTKKPKREQQSTKEKESFVECKRMVTLPRTKVCGRKTLLSERDLTLRQKEKSKAFGLFFHRPPPQPN